MFRCDVVDLSKPGVATFCWLYLCALLVLGNGGGGCWGAVPTTAVLNAIYLFVVVCDVCTCMSFLFFSVTSLHCFFKFVFKVVSPSVCLFPLLLKLSFDLRFCFVHRVLELKDILEVLSSCFLE